MPDYGLAPPVGFEPTTNGLTASASTQGFQVESAALPLSYRLHVFIMRKRRLKKPAAIFCSKKVMRYLKVNYSLFDYL